MKAELDAEKESSKFPDNCVGPLMHSRQQMLEEAEEEESESEWEHDELSVVTEDGSDMSVCAEDCSEERFVGGDINAVGGMLK